MKYLTLAAIVSFFAWQIANGVPCWSFENECGDSPACDEIPPSAEHVSCYHYYCDDKAECTWDTSKTKYIVVMRRKYFWYTKDNNVRICLGPVIGGPLWVDQKCCLCSQPGVLYQH